MTPTARPDGLACLIGIAPWKRRRVRAMLRNAEGPAFASDAARARFVRSAVHQEAIAKSEPAIVTVRLKRLNMARKDVPRDWAAALDVAALRAWVAAQAVDEVWFCGAGSSAYIGEMVVAALEGGKGEGLLGRPGPGNGGQALRRPG